MSELSTKLEPINGNESVDELLIKLRDNNVRLQQILDVLTGERLEDWTPVRRDGTVSMTNDLNIHGGKVNVSYDSTVGQNQASVRRQGSYFEYSGNGEDWYKLPLSIGTEGQVLSWPSNGGLPIWQTVGSTGVEIDNDYCLYFRQTVGVDTDGDWKIVIDSNKLCIKRLESSTWKTKGEFIA